MSAVAAVLLAAGLARRFRTDKTIAPLGGDPLAAHAARALLAVPLAHRFVVTGATPLTLDGFVAVPNARPKDGMGRSVALGVAAARDEGAAAVLITLADMPFVTPDHLRRLLALDDGADAIVASTDGARTMPPALFGARWFAELTDLEGDAGARALLARATLVPAPPAELADIDTPADLAGAEARWWRPA